MGFLDRIRGQKKKPKSKPRPKSNPIKQRQQPIVKHNLPLTKSTITNEDLMREIKTLYLLISKNHIELKDGLLNFGRYMSPERFNLKLQAVEMLDKGYSKNDISKELNVPLRTIYRWLKN